MSADLDHVVISVADLAASSAGWTAAGLPAVAGGRHPAGTRNALVRGPRPAYVELITADADATGPWADQVRSRVGPLSWAVRVDDVALARDALRRAGFDPGDIADGTRLTPAGETLRWRLCDVAAAPFDAELPFLIEWLTPMPPGPPTGPVVTFIEVDVADPARLSSMLTAIGMPRPTGLPEFGDLVAVRLGHGTAGIRRLGFRPDPGRPTTPVTLDGLTVQR